MFYFMRFQPSTPKQCLQKWAIFGSRQLKTITFMYKVSSNHTSLFDINVSLMSLIKKYNFQSLLSNYLSKVFQSRTRSTNNFELKFQSFIILHFISLSRSFGRCIFSSFQAPVDCLAKCNFIELSRVLFFLHASSRKEWSLVP